MSQVEEYMTGRAEKETKERPSMIDIISPETYEKLKKEAGQKSTSLRRHTNDILDFHFETQEMLKKMFPDLEVIMFKEGLLYIMDSKRNTIAKIGLNNGGLFHCDLCKKSDCVHVLVAMAQYELPKLERFPK